MAFNIEEFKSGINGIGGLAFPSMFGVQIAPSKVKTLEGSERVKTANLLAYATTLPGVTFDTIDIRRQGFGPLERRAGQPIFPNVTVNFLLDNKGEVLSFFHDWLRAVGTWGDIPGEGNVDGVTGGFLGQVGYYDDYTCDITIVMYNQMSDKIVEYKLIEAYPAQVADVTLSWRQVDEIAELQVTFFYRHWNATYYDAVDRKPEGKKLNLLQFISKVKGAVDIIKSFKKPKSVGDAINLINNGKTLLKGFGG